METIGKLFENRLKKTFEERVKTAPKRGGINSPFNDAVWRVCEFMKDNRFGYWCGRLKTFSAQEIDSMLSIARQDGKKPQAYFNFLVKKKRELSTANTTPPVDIKPKLL